MRDPAEDVPAPVDFRVEEAARQWAEEAEQKNPGRVEFFELFATDLARQNPVPRFVLELGSGPGFLAEHLLRRCAFIEEYTLLDFSRPMLEMSRKTS